MAWTGIQRWNGRWLAFWGGLLASGAASAAGLNDTGQTTCYDDDSAESPEPSTHPRQDCTVGRDAAAGGDVAQDRRGEQGLGLHQDRQ